MALADEVAAIAEMPEIKLFGRWSSDDVQVSDISLTVSIPCQLSVAKPKISQFSMIWT